MVSSRKALSTARPTPAATARPTAVPIGVARLPKPARVAVTTPVISLAATTLTA